jgi:hypothetical protein
MIRIILLLSTLAAVAIAMACGSSPANNSNVYLTNANSVNVANNSNVPAVIDNPVNTNMNSSEVNSPIASTTPDVPAANAVSTLPKGATPTPGIPSPAAANKMVKPGVTPTPGIPDRETLRRQMQGLDTTNMNAEPGGDMRMMKKPRRPGNVNQ